MNEAVQPSSAPPAPDPAVPNEPAINAPNSLAELVGQVVDVTATGDTDGVPYAVINGRAYLATSDWAGRCVSWIAGELAARNAPALRVKVVNEPPYGVGFRNP